MGINIICFFYCYKYELQGKVAQSWNDSHILSNLFNFLEEAERVKFPNNTQEYERASSGYLLGQPDHIVQY